jgi:nucleotide-binding universal stress UspA family protein
MAVERVGPVVVGVDESPLAMAPVYLAAEEAMGRVTPLVVVHALAGWDDLGSRERAARLSQARRLTAAAVAEAVAAHPGLAVSASVVPGEPERVLVDESRDACLLVVGHRRRPHHVRGAATDGVADRLIGRVPVPVIVYHRLDTSGHAVLPRPVLLGVAGAHDDEAAVEFAFAEASLRGAPLLALHADAPPSRTGVVGYDMDAARGEARQRLADVVTPWADKYPDVQVELLVRHGLDAAIALTAASHAAQLAVVGASGCVARVLLQRAQCATAVIPV